MKTLHQFNPEGVSYETLCGKVLHPDPRTREDVLLATLIVSPEDIQLNFGDQCEKCEQCLTKCPGGDCVPEVVFMPTTADEIVLEEWI